VTFESTDGGDSWHSAGFGFFVNRLRFLSDTLGYAVGQTVYKYSTDSTATDVREVVEEIPGRFYLSQNYPNPFNPTTTWRFTISSSSFVSIKVFDLLGRDVATLVQEEREAGTYEVRFNATNLAGGTYIYRIMAGEFVQSRRMILLR